MGTGQMAHGKHQRLSSFWTQHIQRAARAEIALRLNKAHKDAEREQKLKWYTFRVRLQTLSTSKEEPGYWGMSCARSDLEQGFLEDMHCQLLATLHHCPGKRMYHFCDMDGVCNVGS